MAAIKYLNDHAKKYLSSDAPLMREALLVRVNFQNAEALKGYTPDNFMGGIDSMDKD